MLRNGLVYYLDSRWLELGRSHKEGVFMGKICIFAVVSSLGTASVATAQEYTPLPSAPAALETVKPQSLLAVGLPSLAKNLLAASSVIAPEPATDPWKCTNPPKLTDLKTKTVSKSMSSAMAVSLGFPVGKVGGSADQTVLIQDWSRQAPCLSTDGKTTLIYGQAIRVFTSITSVNANTQLTFPVIAAEATLNNKATSVESELIAVNDVTSQVLATKLLGQLTVENFAEKNEIVQKLAADLVASKNESVALIGVQRETPELRLQVASAFGVQQVAKGRSCLDAKSRINSVDVAVSAAIEGAYLALDNTCGTTKPSTVSQALAKQALLGRTVD